MWIALRKHVGLFSLVTIKLDVKERWCYHVLSIKVLSWSICFNFYDWRGVGKLTGLVWLSLSIRFSAYLDGIKSQMNNFLFHVAGSIREVKCVLQLRKKCRSILNLSECRQNSQLSIPILRSQNFDFEPNSQRDLFDKSLHQNYLIQ